MSSSDEIKEAIVQYFNVTDLPGGREKDWKRVRKVALGGGDFLREFHNATLGRTVYTVGEDEDAQIVEADQWIYGICEDGTTRSLSFEPEDRWRRTAHIHDQHELHGLQVVWGLPMSLGELMENAYEFEPAFNELTIHMALRKCGFKHSQDLTDFLNNKTNPVAQAPLAPVNPPVPAAILGTGKAHAVPTAPVTMVPASPPSPTSPMVARYPELALQQPSVVTALVSARIMGKLGLEQENVSWDEESKIQADFNAGTYEELDVERSHALWLLYESADDGSGEVIDDYFAMSNGELTELMEDMFNNEVVVVDDHAAYGAPYDLPVPPDPVFTPPPAGAGGHPAPKGPAIGPASVNARSGSFAGLPTPEPAAPPAAPPPGNVKAEITKNPGDQWAEFCREVWDTVEANQSNLPLDLTWYDNYRPREAQITGLGYQFVRREFTGIVVLMGYLDREGELIPNISIPGAILDDLLATWGGEWNDPEITQEIHKLKGEDPETGFSYSSENLWQDVRVHLDARGWREAK